jgi:hypothetical protein
VRTSSAVIAVIGILSLMIGCSSYDEAVVPDVVGVDVHSAYDQLRRAGFAIQIEEPIDVTPSRAAHVSHQSIDGGSKARVGTPIVLKLDLGGPGLLPWGPTVRMPVLVGKPLFEAVRTLAALGLSWAAAPLPALPATTEPTLLHNYEVTAQRPKPDARFRQTTIRETADGSTLSKTTSVWLAAKLR